MIFYKYLSIAAVLSLGCGISPEDAADQLDYSADHPEKWCDWSVPKPEETDFEIQTVSLGSDPSEGMMETTDIEKYTGFPSGYGITDTYGCFLGQGPWAGGDCFAPEYRTQKWRLWQGTQDAAWHSNTTDEWGAIRNTVNAVGWNLTRNTSGTYEYDTRTGTVHPSGNMNTMGGAEYYGWSLWTQEYSDFDEGAFWTYLYCTAFLYRTAIESRPTYQSASATQKEKYLKNLWSHEMGHCLGLAHNQTSGALMNPVYSFPGPMYNSNLNFTAAEVDMLDQYESLAE